MNRHALHAVLLVSLTAEAEPLRPYVYRVTAYQVVDGDTVRTKLDLGFKLSIDQLARIDGVDAPEKSTNAGKAVAAYVKAWCDKQQTLMAISISQDKYAGRYLAELHGDFGSLADELLRLKLARLYGGEARRPWTETELSRIESAAKQAIAQLATDKPDKPVRVQVWVTDSGDKYHRKKCRFCDESGRAVDLAAVAPHMDACKVCKPPKIESTN